MAYGPKPIPVSIRFWKHVIKGEVNACWNWLGAKNQHGYGRLLVNKSPLYAHRISWELHKGPLQASVHLLHTCDNPSCVNPEHLKLGTQSDNMQDCFKKNRHPSAKITYEEAAEIRNLYKNTVTSYEALGRKYGVTGRTINYIINEGRRG